MEESLNLAQFVLPECIIGYFEITEVKQTQKELHIFLQEKNIVPEEYKNNKLTSKGFFEEIKVQDFPIRGKSVFLIIKRRKWFNEDIGINVFRNWELVASGTRMTKEFAFFLKAINRY
jgi:hypothetical protein